MTADKKGGFKPVESLKHKDRRPNIPTEELRDFVSEAETSPTTMLYPRDPSLDPQLVWKGKEEQDQADLAVPVVPVYIQEKIQPQALIENLRDTARKGELEPELTLFEDFDGLEFDDLIEFYQHDQNWSNRMILGDSLLAMTSLAEKEGLKGKVQMIYMDPPYGIKFGSNWQVSTRKPDVKYGKAEHATRQPEQIKAFRDTWELGIHSYLAYLRDRLVVARELLTESGSIFVQIGDENVHLVRCLLDEVFGAENFAGQIAFYKTSSRSSQGVPSVVDYLVLYARCLPMQKIRSLLLEKQPGERGAKQYTKLISPDMTIIRNMTNAEIAADEAIPEGWRVCRLGPATSEGYQEGRTVPYAFRGETIPIKSSLHWKYDPSPGADMDRLAALGRLRRSGKSVATVLLAEDNSTTPLDNIWLDTGTGSFTEDQVYVVQTGAKAVQRCLLMTTDPGDLVLDPTCGSGTTAYVAEQWGRRWITIDTSRVALALARTRLMAAKYPYYLLADSAEGRKKEAEITGLASAAETAEGDVRKGFVYKRVPHVTLKSIANNPDIKEGMTRQEIDAAIARHADTELLFNQPYEDKKRIRVSGPF